MTEISAISSSSDAASTNVINSAGAGKGSPPGDGSLSFDDFIDMVNPLQHIPVISSIYRAVTDQKINPIARIAGDTMYGGIFGLASAGIAAIGAVADEAVAASNGGKDVSQTVVAALFGDQTDQSVQLADAAPATQPSQQAGLLQTPARQSPILQAPETTLAALAQTQTQIAQNPTSATDSPSSALMADAAKAMPLDRSKLAYGGVMDTSMLQSAQQNQTLALAMAGQNGILQAQRAMRNSRFAVANMPLPGSTPATAPIGATVPSVSPATAAAANIETTPQTQAAMQNLIQQLQNMKGLSQYRNAAQLTPIPSATMDSTN